MAPVRIGIVGVGNMGATHARNIIAGQVTGLKLAALCDADPERTAAFTGVPVFNTTRSLVRSGLVDAVVIATPHFDHTASGIEALKAGLHVLMEKPISVHKADAQRLLRAARSRPRQVFGAVFNQRTDRYYQRIRRMVQEGELGAIQRINWVVTNWFRTEAYYAMGAWRATWAGEGGGLLLNQCPHNLDLLQWIFGMPRKVRAFCSFGRYHDIEVEDEVTAYLEFPGGAAGLFVSSTGEAPGVNRLEIAGDRGRLVYENDRIVFQRNAVPATEFSRTSKEPFGSPPVEELAIPADDHGGQHVAILQNFVDAIREGAPLIAPAGEGIRSLELANAMLLSTWTDATVTLPMNAATYARMLSKKIARSTAKKPRATRKTVADLSGTFVR